MEGINIFYKKHSSLLLSLLFLTGVAFIIIRVIIPQSQSILSLNAQLKQERQKLADYQKSNETLNLVSDVTLDTDFKEVTSALPPSKDISSIYIAITNSASFANVSLTGFSARLGNIFQKKVAPATAPAAPGIPYVVVTLQLSNVDEKALNTFSEALLKQLPLSKIVLISMNSGSADLTVNFFYKPYDLYSLNKNVITPISAKQQEVVNSLPQATQ